MYMLSVTFRVKPTRPFLGTSVVVRRLAQQTAPVMLEPKHAAEVTRSTMSTLPSQFASPFMGTREIKLSLPAPWQFVRKATRLPLITGSHPTGDTPMAITLEAKAGALML